MITIPFTAARCPRIPAAAQTLYNDTSVTRDNIIILVGDRQADNSATMRGTQFMEFRCELSILTPPSKLAHFPIQ